MHVYSLMPIDFWPGWMTEDQYIEQIGTTGKIYSDDDACASAVADYTEFREQMFSLAKKKGWEGDIREGPFVAALPKDGGSTIMLAWKQDNNGTTFVVSPVALPWLKSW